MLINAKITFMKKIMDFATKAKLIYSGELLIISVVFIVVAILKLTDVFKYNEIRSLIFNWITLFGGTWVIADLIWAIVDKKRQKRICLLDKIIHAPAGIYLVSFDLYCLINQPGERFYQIGIPVVLLYLAVCYIFEAIYHYKSPIPGLLEDEEVNNQQVEDSLNENQGEENNNG